MRRLGLIAAVLAMLSLAFAGNAFAAFGLREVSAEFTEANGDAATLAGSHPFQFTTTFQVSTVVNSEGEIPDEQLKDLEIGQITGLVGSQNAVPVCTSAEFNRRIEGRPSCPDATAVGFAGIKGEFKAVPPGEEIFDHVPVYNVQPFPGAAAEFGLIVLNVPILIEVQVSQNPPYNLVAHLRDNPQSIELDGSKLTIWGNPESPAHDEFRGNCMGELFNLTPEPVSLGSCPVNHEEAPEVAYLTLPRACSGPQQPVFTADSWGAPGLFTAPKSPDTPFVATGCDELGFDPTISAGGTNPASESPSGLDFDLKIDDPGLGDPNGRAQSDIERAIVTLPAGFTTNPAVASGLGACSLQQYEDEALEFSPARGCPGSATVGTVEVISPLLDEPVDGQIYVAKQRENKFGSLLALYMILRNEKNGILIKQPMKIETDAGTGQLTSSVVEIPQLPFSDFHLHFRSGARAPLITSATCGNYQVSAQLFPYANPAAPVTRTTNLEVTSGAGGGSCSGSATQLPNSPSFSAGTLDPNAGTYSPFVLELSRNDGTQQFSSIAATLPNGLLGKLAGITYCSEAQISAANGRSAEFDGALEEREPSCPKASEVGTVTAATGSGSEPLYVQGHAYLAGPYNGAPLSLEIVTPAIAGPFDLGTVAVRTALRVNPETTEITAVSDPLPTILHGLPLDIRSISIDMNRPNFTLNPTSCEPKAITGSVTSTVGSTASVSQHFQVANCRSLSFKPKLQLSLKGSTTRTGHPALRAVLTYPKGGAYANIARAQVNLPHSEFIEQANLNKTCTKPVLLEGKCPKSTIYGKAKAWTPLLDKPLQGDVYLVGGFGYKLPALVAELNGQIRVLLKGKVDSGPNGGIRNTFEAVPDAPVEKFELNLKGGPKYSLLVNSENLCKKPQKAIARFTAQNGKVLQTKPVIANSCKKKSQGGGKKKKSGSGGKKHGKK